MLERIKNELTQEHEGAVAFEYIIILVLMATVIFIAWRMLGDALMAKVEKIAKFISDNGGKSGSKWK